MDFYNHTIQNLFNFSGRTRREYFWKTMGAVFAINIVLAILMPFDLGIITGTLSFIFNVVFFVLLLGISMRRLHDTGKSGWYLLLMFIPVIGQLILIYFWVQDSERMPNEYGPSPKYDNPEYDSFQSQQANF